jgi:hypothetical protein
MGHRIEADRPALRATIAQGMSETVRIHSARQVQVIEQVNKDQVEAFIQSMDGDDGIPLDDAQVRPFMLVEMAGGKCDDLPIELDRRGPGSEMEFIA